MKVYFSTRTEQIIEGIVREGAQGKTAGEAARDIAAALSQITETPFATKVEVVEVDREHGAFTTKTTHVPYE